MSLHERELARRADASAGEIHARSSPLRLTIPLDPPPVDAEGLAVHGTVTLRVCVGPSAADRQLLADELLRDASSVGADELQARFAGPVVAAAADALRAVPADVATREAGRLAIAESIRRAADRCAFRLGLAIAGTLEVDLHCPVVVQRQQHARLLEEIERCRTVAERFAELRAAHSDLSVAEMLKTIDPQQRDALIAGVMRGAARTPSRLWIASGTTLSIAEAGADRRASIHRTIELAELGPVRSVQAGVVDGARRLAIGCRAGAIILDPEAPKDRVLLPSTVQTDRGFNAVAVDGEQVCASHGDLGLVAWSIRGGAHELHRWPAPGALGVLRTNDGAILLAEPRRVRALRDNGLHDVMDFDADLIALVSDGATHYAMLEDGQVFAFGRAGPTRRQHHPAKVAAGAMWDSPIGPRLLRATDQPGIESFGFDDEMIHRYTAAQTRVRMVAAAGTIILGVSPDRQRIVLWNAWDPIQPATELNVTATTRHRIADVAMA